MSEFKPVLYLKKRCPFCFKVRVFLLEAGLIDETEIREFSQGSPEEAAIKGVLEPHLEKVSFPAAQVAPGQYMTESDGIIAYLASKKGLNSASLPLLKAYVEGPFQSLSDLYKENAELKKRTA